MWSISGLREGEGEGELIQQHPVSLHSIHTPHASKHPNSPWEFKDKGHSSTSGRPQSTKAQRLRHKASWHQREEPKWQRLVLNLREVMGKNLGLGHLNLPIPLNDAGRRPEVEDSSWSWLQPEEEKSRG